MRRMFELLHESLFNGKSAAVCTVVSTDGSSPASQGTMMLVLPDGATCGTIGGGALELNAQKTALQVLQTNESVTKHYGLAAGKNDEIGMVCGGDAEVAVQFFDAASNRDLVFCATALNLVSAESQIKAGAGSEAEIVQFFKENKPLGWGLYVNGKALRFTKNIDTEPPEGVFVHIELNKKPKVCIFGAGHIAKALVPFLLLLDFEVTVFDNRPEFADPKAFPERARVVEGDYADIYKGNLKKGTFDYAVVLTHAHANDNEVLKQLLQSPVYYIGCIGSRKKAENTKACLKEWGFAEDEIKRIHTPVGLEIGAKTPQEIALSIAAEIVAKKSMLNRGQN